MKSGYFTPDMEQYIPDFFIDLEKEINSPNDSNNNNQEVCVCNFFSLFCKIKTIVASAPVPVSTAVASVDPAPVAEEVAPVVPPAREQRKRKNQTSETNPTPPSFFP